MGYGGFKQKKPTCVSGCVQNVSGGFSPFFGTSLTEAWVRSAVEIVIAEDHSRHFRFTQ
jgi:hypothetical protein